MQFQHATALQPTLIQKRTPSFFASGQSGGIIIPGGDPTLTIIVEQYVISYSYTTVGEIIIYQNLGVTNPTILYPPGTEGTLVVPIPGEQIIIGTFGLKVQDTTAGGGYYVMVWYTVYQS